MGRRSDDARRTRVRRRRAPASSFVRAHRLVAVLALVAALGFVAVPSSCETSDARDGEGISSLSAWLAKFKFDLPKQTFRVPYAGIDVELDAMTCVNLTVGALASETTATATVDVGGGDGEGELRATLSDVKFNCALQWKVTDRLGNHAVGDAAATVSQSSARFSFALDVDKERAPPLPREVKLSDCQAQLLVTDLLFTGGRFATVLNTASLAIRTELGRTLSALTCSSATNGLEKFSGTAKGQRWEDGQLARDERAIASLLKPAASTPFPTYNATDGIVNLSASPLVRWVEYMTESYIGAQGVRSVSAFARWIEAQNEENNEYNARVVQVPQVWLFDSETHLPKVSVSLTKDILREVATTIEGAAFIVYDIKVLGLETAKTLRGPSVVTSPTVPNASSIDTRLSFTIGWDRILFNVSGVLDILPTNIQLDPWIEPLIVSFELRDPEFVVEVGLAVDGNELKELKGTRQANLACVSQTIRDARVLSLDWTGRAGSIIVNPWRRDRPVDESDDSLEASLDALITQTSLLITEQLDEAVRLAVSHQLGSTARNALDEELRRRIDRVRSATCPRMTRVSLRVARFKRAFSIALLYTSAICAGMFVTVLFGHFALVVALGRFGRWCFRAVMKQLAAMSAHADDEWEVEGDESDDEDGGIAYSTPQQTSARRNYSRASFHSGRRVEAAADDTSMITESLLGEAEIDEEGNIDVDEKSLMHRQAALCDSIVVPKSAKFGMPILYAMTCLLFLASNTSVGATVTVRAIKHDLGSLDSGADIYLPEVFTFSLGDTVLNMWRAGVYTLALLILLFSGVWPYAKLVAMWISWSTPGLDLRARGQFLKNLDAFGKWSLLDSFVLMLFMVLFHFEVRTPEDVSGYGALTVSVHPQRGFFVFLLATVLSMILGHITTGYHHLHEHRYIFGEAGAPDEDEDNEESAEIMWMRMRYSETKKWILGVATTVLLIGTMVALVIGFKAIAIRFTMLGVAGAALGPDSSTHTMSLRSVAAEVRNASPDLHASLSRLIEWTMLIFAFAMPLVRITTMVILWTLPLTSKQRHAFLVCKEVVDAWSALDVMLFSFVAAISQIRQFLAFMLGGNCDALNRTLQQFVSGPLSHAHDLCFDVDSSLGDGCWLLAVCVVGSSACSRILDYAAAIVREEDENAYRVASSLGADDVDNNDSSHFETPL